MVCVSSMVVMPDNYMMYCGIIGKRVSTKWKDAFCYRIKKKLGWLLGRSTLRIEATY